MAGSTPVAVKFVNRQSPRELRRFVHEIGILKSLRHTNIVQARRCIQRINFKGLDSSIAGLQDGLLDICRIYNTHDTKDI